MTNDVASHTAYLLEPTLPWESDIRTNGDSALERVAVFDGGNRKPCLLRSVSPVGATICGDLALSPGAEVSVELATGQRPKATAEWADATDVGLRFDQPVNVIPLINRQLLSQPAERRTVPRVEIRTRAWIEASGVFTEAIVRNISSRGLQVEAEALPEIGASLRLFVEGLNVPPARLVWKDGNVAGVELAADLPWATTILWIRELARARQMQEPISPGDASGLTEPTQ